MSDYERFLIDPDPVLAAQGWRLRVYRDEEEATVLVERERTLPEQVGNPDARAVLEARSFGYLHPDEVRWLRDRLNELLDTSAGLDEATELVAAHAGAIGVNGEFATWDDALRAVLDRYGEIRVERDRLAGSDEMMAAVIAKRDEALAFIERVVHEEGGPDDLPHRAVADMIEWYRSRESQ